MSTKRYILITVLKVLVVIALMMLCLMIGMMIGYGVIGDGHPLDVFNDQVWMHIMEFIQ